MPFFTLIAGTAALTTLGGFAALALRFSTSTPQVSQLSLADKIDALLPQTQCGQCGHPGCRPYAEAIARGEVFNRCPPGREHTVAALAELLHEQVLPLDIDGELKPKAVAYIREDECIGCTKCIQACPVDAILGATKLMHTVIADQCTGCDLCVEPCPVDCIDMLPLPDDRQLIKPIEAAQYKARFNAHNLRLQRDAAEHEQRRQARREALKNKPTESAATQAPTSAQTQMPAPASTSTQSKQEQIQAAIARAKVKKAASNNAGPHQ
jgi:H+/Na+-translocating ferredoxin:NAD+ oxidoreductase subunit B